MQETRILSLGGEDLLEKEMSTHSTVLAWKIPWGEEPGMLHTVHGVTKNWTRLKRLQDNSEEQARSYFIDKSLENDEI